MDDMFEFMPMFEFMDDMFEFMVVCELMVPPPVVVLLPLAFEFIVAMFEFAVFVLSVGVQPTAKTAIVSTAKRAKYRRIEYPPDPPKRFMISELPQASSA
ncbi:MAG: hypothetical protein WKF30_11415 [Pyrinomonadaceae bacterium]